MAFSFYRRPRTERGPAMFFSSWLGNRWTKAKAGFRPRLSVETLEDRITPSGSRLLMLGAEGASDMPAVRSALASTGVLGGATIDYLDTRFSTPSLATLQQYNAVLAWTDFLPWNPTGLGNVL